MGKVLFLKFRARPVIGYGSFHYYQSTQPLEKSKIAKYWKFISNTGKQKVTICNALFFINKLIGSVAQKSLIYD